MFPGIYFLELDTCTIVCVFRFCISDAELDFYIPGLKNAIHSFIADFGLSCDL